MEYNPAAKRQPNDLDAYASIAEVRDAMRTLLSALDRFEGVLGAMAPPSGDAEAGQMASTPIADGASWPPHGEPMQPSPEAQDSPPNQSGHPSSWGAGQQAPAPEWSSWADASAPMEPAAWPYPRPPEPAPAASDSWPSTASEEDAAREEVRRAVEQMRSELGGTPSPIFRFVDHRGEHPDDLRLRAAASDSESGGEPDPALTGAVEPDPWPGEGAGDDSIGDEDAREQVRRAVEKLKSEFGPEGEEGGPDEAEAALDVREQVRRAVEEAKAELDGNSNGSEPPSTSSIAEAFDPQKFKMPDHGVIDERLLQPALLVIDDPEGRVELVRVYRTLARLEIAATANLANYSSHSVTVQLEERKVPDRQDIADAIAYAFDRECAVDIDGNRASVRLFNSKSKAA